MQTLGETAGLRAIVEQFSAAPVESIAALGNGHIHQTYVVRFAAGAGQVVLQRLNTYVFSELAAVMQNIELVTSHVRARLQRAGESELHRRILSLRYTRAGKTHHEDPALGTYRMFEYVDASQTLSSLTASHEAFEAGRVCGEFARLLEDLQPTRLHTILPDFHATDRRFDALVAAMAADAVGRTAHVAPEWKRLRELEPLARECATWAKDPELRVRITHNDTKLDNVLFDATTRRALCLVDLDTVMPGYVAYDFGDLVRSCVCTAAEDARDPSQVGVRFEWFDPLARGYLSELTQDLTALELRSLARGTLWIVLELALRFLTDFVQGDRYFKIARAEHNLDRTRVMLALLTRLLEHESEMQRVIEAAARGAK
ncbi:MAG TPA: aminoglycoside phosphotransferase family protein [Polyangiales bacterium]|nr:aminoglycoside phosphotransferase family protein [Polyangiales bacterium]